MKPEIDSQPPELGDPQDDAAITGDVIGNTAYSERFVLKILIKFVKPEELKAENLGETFEDDLDILWDMTAEEDVVKYLLQHGVLKLFQFALPYIESSRVIEVIIGIISNMCVYKYVTEQLIKMDELFLCTLVGYIKTDDSPILIQVLRLVSAMINHASDEDITKWMDLFEKVEYADSLYFILKNSANKDVLTYAFENMRFISFYCLKEHNRASFFNQFVSAAAVESIFAAFTETIVTQVPELKKVDVETILTATQTILLTLAGFTETYEINTDLKKKICDIICITLLYYESKILDKEMDPALIDILDDFKYITFVLNLSQVDSYFQSLLSVWKSFRDVYNEPRTFEDNVEEIEQFAEKIQPLLSSCICQCIEKSVDSSLNDWLEQIGPDLDNIIEHLDDHEFRSSVLSKTANYRRLRDNVDS